MQADAEQKNSGVSRAHAMSGNVDQTVQSENERANHGSEAEALVGSLLQGQNVTQQENDPNHGQHDRRPSHLRPEPEPVALRMQSARRVQRFVTEQGENGIK